MRLPLAADNPRRDEILRALEELQFLAPDSSCKDAEKLADSVALRSLDCESLVDACHVLALTDLELCFWPPEPASVTEARHALELLKPCTRRRAVLLARRLLLAERAAVAVEGPCGVSPADCPAKQLKAVLDGVQARVDAFCGPPLSLAAQGSLLGSLAEDVGSMGLTAADVFAHPALRLCSHPQRGSGLAAGERLEAGTEVLRIPEVSLLNVFSALRSDSFAAAATELLLAGMHTETVTMLFSITERRRCSSTSSSSKKSATSAPWADLLAKAPRVDQMPQLLVWPSEAVEALGSAQVASVVEAHLKEIWELSKQVNLALQRLPRELRLELPCVDFDDLLWARCLFDSRSVALEISAPDELSGRALGASPPQELALASENSTSQWLHLKGVWVPIPSKIACLAPVMDFLNHDIRGSCASPAFDAQRRCLSVATVASVPVGAELCICYGALQNWELLFYYGFCPSEPNPHDRFTISLEPQEEDPEATAREVLFRLHCIPADHVLRPLFVAEQKSVLPLAADEAGWSVLGALSPQLLRCLRLLLAEEPDVIDVNVAPLAPPASSPPKSVEKRRSEAPSKKRSAAEMLEEATPSEREVVGDEAAAAAQAAQVAVAALEPPRKREREQGSGGDQAKDRVDVMRCLDDRCLETLEGLLTTLLEPFEATFQDPPQPLWWQQCGDQVEAFRASQRCLLASNLAEVVALRQRLQLQPQSRPPGDGGST